MMKLVADNDNDSGKEIVLVNGEPLIFDGPDEAALYVQELIQANTTLDVQMALVEWLDKIVKQHRLGKLFRSRRKEDDRD